MAVKSYLVEIVLHNCESMNGVDGGKLMICSNLTGGDFRYRVCLINIDVDNVTAHLVVQFLQHLEFQSFYKTSEMERH